MDFQYCDTTGKLKSLKDNVAIARSPYTNILCWFQNLSKPEFLGRTLGLDFGLARVAETIIAFIAGRMEDSGYSNGEISYFVASISAFFLCFWGVYHLRGKGAALPKFNAQYNKVDVHENEPAVEINEIINANNTQLK